MTKSGVLHADRCGCASVNGARTKTWLQRRQLRCLPLTATGRYGFSCSCFDRRDSRDLRVCYRFAGTDATKWLGWRRERRAKGCRVARHEGCAGDRGGPMPESRTLIGAQSSHVLLSPLQITPHRALKLLRPLPPHHPKLVSAPCSRSSSLPRSFRCIGQASVGLRLSAPAHARATGPRTAPRPKRQTPQIAVLEATHPRPSARPQFFQVNPA
jgi:hypothetical protein